MTGHVTTPPADRGFLLLSLKLRNARTDIFINPKTSTALVEVGSIQAGGRTSPFSVRDMLADKSWLDSFKAEIPEHHPTLKTWIEGK